MGITFRSGGYIRHVLMGGRTIKDGEAAAIWDRQGTQTQIIGPRRIWLFSSTIRFLTRHKAESNQFLKVSHRDGRVEHIVGPAVLYENPAYHDKVSVEDGFRLCSNNECIVTFSSPTVGVERDHSNKSDDDTHETELNSPSSLKEAKAVSKRIIYGPTLFIPKPSEYVHSFSWSRQGTNNDFQILQTSGNASFRVSIPTIDGFTFDASLILSYTTSSIDKLIANKDPISQLFNGIRFDSQTLGDAIPSNLLKSKKEDIVKSLSQTETYPSLLQAATKCGLQIKSIQVTTIDLCSSLKTQIDDEQKLQAVIQSEIAKKAHSHQLRQMENEAKQKCVEEEAELKKKEVRMNDELDVESHKLKLAAMERKLELERLESDGMRGMMKAKEDSILEFLMKVKQMDVDMTKFMTTYGGIELADKVVSKSDMLQKKVDGWGFPHGT